MTDENKRMTLSEAAAHAREVYEDMKRRDEENRWKWFIHDMDTGEFRDEWIAYAKGEQAKGESGAMSYQSWMDERYKALLQEIERLRAYVASLEDQVENCNRNA